MIQPCPESVFAAMTGPDPAVNDSYHRRASRSHQHPAIESRFMEINASTDQHATEHKLPDTIAVLSRTPAALNALLRDLPDVWTRQNEGGDSWSVFDVIGHLIEGERTDWVPRARIIVQFGETQCSIRSTAWHNEGRV